LEAKYKAAKELIKKLQTELRNQLAISKKLEGESNRLSAEIRSAKNELRNLKVRQYGAQKYYFFSAIDIYSLILKGSKYYC